MNRRRRFILPVALVIGTLPTWAQEEPLPGFFRGVWGGTVIQVNPQGFPTFICLLEGKSAELVGTNTTYGFFRLSPPHWALGHYVLNEVIDEGHLKLEETFTQGNPIIIGGYVEFVRIGEDQFHYSWQSGGDSSAGDFTRLSTDADDLPPEYHGIWSGWLVTGDVGRAVRLTLAGSAVGSPVGVFDQMAGNCGGLVTLEDAGADQVMLSETHDYGPCPWDPGSMTASLLPSGKLAVEWENSTETCRGELVRALAPDGVSAAFTADPPSGVAPLAVHFDAGASTSPAETALMNFYWDFGDGDKAEGQTAMAEHTFTEPGRYPVNLTATNNIGLQGSTNGTIQALCPGAPVLPFSAEDLGAPNFPGSSRPDGEGIALCVGGRRLSGSTDRFHFVHRPVDCDAFTFTARVAAAASETALAQVGLMVREGLNPGARHVSLVLEKLNPGTASQVRLVSRTTESGTTAYPAIRNAPAPPAVWLRLTRDGDGIKASVSEDGVIWDEDTFTPVTLDGLGRAAEVYIGFAGMGGETLVLAATFKPLEATFVDIKVESCPPGKSFRRGDADANGMLQITDPVRILGHLFLGESEPECLEAADTDNNGEVDISDVIANLSYQFTGGEPPAPPGPAACGQDPQVPFLGCEQVCP